MIKNAAKLPALSIAMMLSTSVFAMELDDLGMDQDFGSMDGLEHVEFEMPVVLTAARLRQSQLDTPASVTVIEADTIAALGFKNIEEIFRLVPGMLVGYHSGFGEKAPSVSYHGTNAPEHRRLQVLIDGRSVFKPGLARVEWVDIPLAVEDIARIEVIRGPNSAAYGANSYLGIINILTKHPSNEKGTTIKLTAGSRDVQDSYVNISSSLASTDFRWTIGSKQKSGFDVLNNGNENRDASEGIYTNLRTFTELSPVLSMEWQLGYKDGVNEQVRNLDQGEDLVTYLEQEDIEAQDYFLWNRTNYQYSKNHSGQFQIYSQKFVRTTEWDVCLVDAIQNALNLAEHCGTLNKNLDEQKTEIEYQHTSVWSQAMRSVVGMRLRLDEMDSKTYSAGHLENVNTSAFFNLEHKWKEYITSNLGGMWEEDDLNGSSFSPRFALNYHFNKNHTLRFIYSEAIRSPDLFEQEGQLIFEIEGTSISGSGDDPFVYNRGDWFAIDGQDDLHVATGMLENEKIYSHEVSYFGLFPDINAHLDLKVFYDDLNGLITQALDHDPTKPLISENKIVQKGIEGQFNWKVNADNQILISFSQIDSDDDFENNNSNVGREKSLTYDTSGSLAWISSLASKTKLGVAYYRADNGNTDRRPEGYDFSRVDTTLSHEVSLHNDYALKLKGTIQYRLDDDPLLYENNTYEDKEHYYFSAQLNF